MTKRIAAPAYTYTATVLHVVDGDSLDARIDVGFRLFAEMPLRLNGLNCPEKNTTAGQNAKAYVEAWVDEHPAIVVATFKNPEKYGRWLALIADGAHDDTQTSLTLNAALLQNGHAFPWDGQGPRPVTAPPATP